MYTFCKSNPDYIEAAYVQSQQIHHFIEKVYEWILLSHSFIEAVYAFSESQSRVESNMNDVRPVW